MKPEVQQSFVDAQDSNVSTINITTEMKDCYIDYAMSVIVGRALPDVRDGLKPVHRRILYSMHELGMTPERQFRKSVRIVGDVLGKFHPHGDASVYDAMVRMAQDFSTRYPTIMGHGNFGSIDGDGAAAMRYTEAKMDYISQEMLRDINKNTVNFIENFDGTEMEPEVLTARFPHLLVNGSQGIAVGMATNMPPHNLAEVIDATISYIDHPNTSVDSLMKKMPGPDFPTGGIIMGSEGIKEAYETGKGKLKVRGKATIEEGKRGKHLIVISEIPYMVNKAKLNEKIHNLAQQGKIQGIVETRDESDLKNGIRLVVETKKGFDPQIILNRIYQLTELESTFGVTNLALVPDKKGKLHPKILGLKDILEEYVKHQKEVITRRTQFDLEKAEKRAHILEGLIIALDNIDEVIEIIRKSRDGNSARKKLMNRFKLSEAQAQAILDMRLQRLTGLERNKLKAEFKDLQKLIKEYKKILSDEKEVLRVIKEELREIKKSYKDDRRTQIGESVNQEDIVTFETKDLDVTLSHNGYLNSSFSERNRKPVIAEGDSLQETIKMQNTDDLLFFTNKGRAYKLKGTEIPETRGKGTHIHNLLNFDGGERLVAVVPVKEEETDREVVMATSGGLVKRIRLSEFNNTKKSGINAINLKGEDLLIDVLPIEEKDKEVMLATRNGFSIRIGLDEISTLGRTAAGVKGIGLSEGDNLVSLIKTGKYIISVTEDGYAKATELKNFKKQNRGGKGLLLTDKRSRKISGIAAVENPKDQIIVETGEETMRVQNLPVLSRTKPGEQISDKKINGVYEITEYTLE